MKHSLVRLGDICTVVSGSTPKSGISDYWDGDVVWITPAELTEDSYIINDSVRHITQKAVQETSLKPFPAGTVILSSRAPIGKTAIAGREMYCNQGFKNLICSSRVNNKYLYFFLSCKTEYLNSLGRGATFKEISKTIVENIEIPLPGIPEQKRIATEFEHIQGLEQGFQKQVSFFDQLVKSQFVEMFGDPMTNPHNLPKVILGSVLTIEPQNGLYKPQSDYVSDGTGVPILRIDSFYDGKVSNFPSLKRLICSEIELKRYSLYENDIVINRVNSIEYLGKCGLIRGLVENTVFESNMMRLHVDEHKFHPVYITKLLCSQFIYQQILKRAKKAVNQASINQKDVQSFVVYMPSIEQQEQFAAFVAQVDKSKVEIQKAIDQLEILKKSLMQQYFG